MGPSTLIFQNQTLEAGSKNGLWPQAGTSLTFPVRTSKRTAPRLHQSAAGVASSNPHSSGERGGGRRGGEGEVRRMQEERKGREGRRGVIRGGEGKG